MFYGSGKFTRALRFIIDILNVILGIGVIVLAVLAFINTSKNAWMFPIIFLGGAVMNLFTGIKNFMTDRKIGGIVCTVVAIVLAGVAYFTFRAIGG